MWQVLFLSGGVKHDGQAYAYPSGIDWFMDGHEVKGTNAGNGEESLLDAGEKRGASQSQSLNQGATQGDRAEGRRGQVGEGEEDRMTLKQAVAKHEVEISELKVLHQKLEKAMIELTNKQGETNRMVTQLGRTVDRFIRSLEGGNGHRRQR
jgi:hypothetical protein